MDDNALSTLARAYRDGDQASFRKLVETLSRLLVARAYRYTADWEWARDLTQETWIKVHESIQRYDPARSFRAWVFAIHRNGCLDHLRRGWLRNEVPSADDAIGHLTSSMEGSNPEQQLERREFHRRLIEALDGLSESQRQVFVRVELEEHDQRDVARELEISPATVRTTLHFARRRLAKILRTEEDMR